MTQSLFSGRGAGGSVPQYQAPSQPNFNQSANYSNILNNSSSTNLSTPAASFSTNTPMATANNPFYSHVAPPSTNINIGTSAPTTPAAPTTPNPAQLTPDQINSFMTQLKNIQMGVNTLKTGTQGVSANPVNLQTNTGNSNTVNSTSLSGGKTIPDLLNQQQSGLSNLLNGQGNGSPSTSLQQEVANQLYQSTLYNPQQLSDIQRNKDAQQAVNDRTIKATADVKALMDNGSITKEQGAGMVSETQRRANEDLAFLSGTQSNYANQVAVDELKRQNQIQALTGLQSSLQPTQVSPGSSLYNPITGTQYQGTGAAPAQIFSTAQSLKQNDQMTGNLQMNPDGTVNDNYYYSKAQQVLSPGSSMGSSSSGITNGPISGNSGQLPSQLQTYLNVSGGEYINSARVPAAQQDLVKQLAAQNNIPYLEAGDVSSVQAIDYTKANVAKIGQVVDQILGDGAVGKGLNIAKATLNSLFPLSEVRTAFNANRETAIKQIQSLVAGSGSGFRLTQPEIDQAVSQMPTQNDSLSVAKAKIAWLNSFLDTKKSLALTGTIGPQSAAPGTTGSSSSNPFAPGNF